MQWDGNIPPPSPPLANKKLFRSKIKKNASAELPSLYGFEEEEEESLILFLVFNLVTIYVNWLIADSRAISRDNNFPNFFGNTNFNQKFVYQLLLWCWPLTYQLKFICCHPDLKKRFSLKFDEDLIYGSKDIV